MNSENAGIAVLEQCSMFGIPTTFMFEGPNHFKNENLRLVAKCLKGHHHFTLVYCPWGDGAVEHLGRELLRLLRDMICELQMGEKNGLISFQLSEQS